MTSMTRSFAARRCGKEAAQACRVLSLAFIYDGGRRSAAAPRGNITLRIARDWVIRFRAKGTDARPAATRLFRRRD
jgi:transposase